MNKSEIQKQVYDVKVNGESSFEIRGDFGRVSLDDVDTEWYIDEVWNGEVAFTANHKSDDGYYGVAFMPMQPEQAETLGKALLKAAEYAREQK